MIMKFNKYFKNYNKSIYELLNNVDTSLIDKSVSLIDDCNKKNCKIFIVGNGGSSSIANHVSIDFVKAANIKSYTFNNSNLITAFANDYGHDNWICEAIKVFLQKNDVLILISSSGASKNILNAAKYCKNNKINFITFSGFNPNNQLSQMGNVNIHIKSKNYNFIEMSHHIILVSIVDIFAKKLN